MRTLARATIGTVILYFVHLEAGLFTFIAVGILWIWQEYNDWKLARLSALNAMILSAHEPTPDRTSGAGRKEDK